MNSRLPEPSGEPFPTKVNPVSKPRNAIFVPEHGEQTGVSARGVRSASAPPKPNDSVCFPLSSRNGSSPVTLIKLEPTSNLCYLCTNVFQSIKHLFPSGRTSSYFRTGGLTHHATSLSLEESISQGCRLCSQLPVLFNEKVKRKGPRSEEPKLREDISSTCLHFNGHYHDRRVDVTLEFWNITGNSWRLYNAFVISPTESI